MQERGDGVRNLVADTSRRLQQLESDVGRIETLLDVVRDESVAIRAGQTELKHILTQSNGPQAPARSKHGKLKLFNQESIQHFDLLN